MMEISEPTVDRFMTPQPFTIEAHDMINHAQEIMGKHKIRHLPVIDQGKIIGILSDRDILLISLLIENTPSAIRVQDICQKNIYKTSPLTPIHAVADVMYKNRYDSAIIENDGKLVGIFTTVDACRAIVELMKEY